MEAALDGGDEAAWSQYLSTVGALTATLTQLGPRGGDLLTTAEMAARMGISAKTLLKHKARGIVRPALQRGKLIRWRADATNG